MANNLDWAHSGTESGFREVQMLIGHLEILLKSIITCSINLHCFVYMLNLTMASLIDIYFIWAAVYDLRKKCSTQFYMIIENTVKTYV